MMARCRIYLFTYKRKHLLPRALMSLITQTFTNWVCEVHNDSPGDPFPRELIDSFNDPRLIMKDHPANLGPVATFNLAFAGCAEAYASILEDDNWWEPDFLQEMIGFMDDHPAIEVSWSNMKLWREGPENTWTDTGKTIWPEERSQFFEWPDQRQVMGGLHSNGAMIYRGRHAPDYLLPDTGPFDAIELFRERSFGHPIYLHGSALANFAITLTTNRNSNACVWIASQVMLLASFINRSPWKNKAFSEGLAFQRSKQLPATANFFLANLFLIKDRSLYKLLTITDWLIVLKWLAGNSHKLNEIKKYLTAQQCLYAFLLEKTQQRFTENRQQTQP